MHLRACRSNIAIQPVAACKAAASSLRENFETTVPCSYTLKQKDTHTNHLLVLPLVLLHRIQEDGSAFKLPYSFETTRLVNSRSSSSQDD